MPLLRPQWAQPGAGVESLSTLRSGGVSTGPYGDSTGQNGLNLGLHVGDSEADVVENRRRLQTFLPGPPVWLTQVHGGQVVDAAKVNGVPEADASFTSEQSVVCVIQTADCLPVLLADTQGRVVGAAHGGWRGLAAGVLENTVAAMRASGAVELMAWLGPAIGPARFEVGADVLDAFTALDPGSAAAFVSSDAGAGKYYADIYRLARRRLHAVGVQMVTGGDRCTVGEAAAFYSYRRDRVTGRMASCIWIR